MFKEIWDMQLDLNKRIGYDTYNDSQKHEYLYMYAEALNDEVIELLECYNINLERRGYLDVGLESSCYNNAKIECIDCLHFLMSIFHILDMKKPSDFCVALIEEEDFFDDEGNQKDIIKTYWEKIVKIETAFDGLPGSISMTFIHIKMMLVNISNLKNRTSWKWWSKVVRENPDRQFKEIIKWDGINEDCAKLLFHLLSLCYQLNITIDDIYNIYYEKWKINHERQENDYDVAHKNENDNKELETKM